MHPELGWMVYRAEFAAHQQHTKRPTEQIRYPRLQHRIAGWSGRRLLSIAQWLLRRSQPAPQWAFDDARR
jgi:hypothetical protein